ncbi:MAG: P-loop NTPase [Deltaproteobacteria bacterium]|nr:P-loop NTPase [Deltaproteobacteria bacterium]
MKRYRDLAGDGGSDVLAQVAAQEARLRTRMAAVRRVVAVMSGKGGVGKSAITVNLAAALALEGARVGVLDADLNGPALAKMLGVRDQRLRRGPEGVLPAVGALGIRVMSMDLLLPGDETPLTWQAPTPQRAHIWRQTAEVSALREFLADTAWGEQDYLWVDLPPGTDRFCDLHNLLPSPPVVVITTIPSEVARLVVQKSVTVARELKAPVAGLLENMAGYVCPACGVVSELFQPGAMAGRLAAEQAIPHLGQIPFDPAIGAAADRGIPFVVQGRQTAAGKALTAAAVAIRAFTEAT